jgi:predicted RNase H-like HicB family nuclease
MQPTNEAGELTMATVESDLQRYSPTIDHFAPRVYECRVWLTPDAEGGYSAIAPLLPGVVSQGETEAKAIENIREAFQGAAAEYLDTGGSIPWSDTLVFEKPCDAKEKWILVHV